jgi:hypothetical protein
VSFLRRQESIIDTYYVVPAPDNRQLETAFDKCRMFSTNSPFFAKKADFQKSQMNLSVYITMNYEQMDTWSRGKNKAKTNPIQTQYKAYFRPGGKNLASSPTIWRRMFEEIPSANFGLNYDPSHLVWQFIDYIRPIFGFKDRIFHVHIKDAKLLRENLNDVGILATPPSFHRPKLPSLGGVDWGKFFSALTDIGYDGSACVEVEERAFEGSLEMRK